MKPLIDETFEARPTAASEARRSLSVLAGQVPEDTYEDVRILVSELVTNSVRHSGVGGGDQVRVRLGVWREPSRLHVEVTDAGPGFEKFVRPSTPDQLGGWGLQIVDRISDRWGVKRLDSAGAAVWFEIDLNSNKNGSNPA
ncbi:MAG TPA: ATP-binding protein [Actinomycetota bacterium]|nr:ATP-binding protein [Actinomycetota bacterium]